MSRRGGLGRGLAALIPTSSSAASSVATPERIDDSRDVAGLPDGEVVHWTGSGDDHTRGGSPDLLEQLGFDMGSPDGTDESDRPAAVWPADSPGRDVDYSAGVGDVADVPGLTLREIRLTDVVPNPQQPRQSFDEDALAELAHSIREFGLLQPIVVRPLEAGGYQLVMGERRLRAAGLAGLETVTALVRDTADDALLRDALLENIHRVALNPLEEAAAYDQLLVEFGVTHEELAGRLGRSRSQITNTIRLLRLPVPVQRRVAAGVLSAGHARAILGLADGSAQEALATRIVAEGLSVRATEELVSTASATPARPRVSRAGRISAPGVEDLADRLSEAYDTRVRVEIGRRKGRIVVEFGSIDDLERIVSLMHSPVSSDLPALSH